MTTIKYKFGNLEIFYKIPKSWASDFRQRNIEEGVFTDPDIQNLENDSIFIIHCCYMKKKIVEFGEKSNPQLSKMHKINKCRKSCSRNDFRNWESEY